MRILKIALRNYRGVSDSAVEFARDGKPLCGYVVGKLIHCGSRFVANTVDEGALRELASGREQVGRRGWVSCEDGGAGRNLFGFGEGLGNM